MALLKKTSTGDWINHEGFVGAIMLSWQPPDDEDGVKHYRFIATPFDSIPHDIIHNGEDDAVLISKDMLNALISRGVARRMTDEEAAEANKNATDDEVSTIHGMNTTRQNETNEANKVERAKPRTAADASKPAAPVKLQRAPVQSADPLLNQSQTASDAATKAALEAEAGKKGK
jgi:hypothetical protein